MTQQKLIKLASSNTEPLDGEERFQPSLWGDIELEHIHRYLIAIEYCSGKSVLDIASGEGYGSWMLSQRAARVTGMDIDSGTIRRAQHKYANDRLNYINGSCEAIPLEDNSFDILVSFETIEHIEEQKQFIKEIKRVLKPKGILITSSPDQFIFNYNRDAPNDFHINELTSSQFTKLIASKFKKYKQADQLVIKGSLIQGRKNSSAITFYEQNHNQEILKSSKLDDLMYNIIIASDAPIPKINTSFYTDTYRKEDGFHESRGQRSPNLHPVVYLAYGDGYKETNKLSCDIVSDLEFSVNLTSSAIAQSIRLDICKKSVLFKLVSAVCYLPNSSSFDLTLISNNSQYGTDDGTSFYIGNDPNIAFNLGVEASQVVFKFEFIFDGSQIEKVSNLVGSSIADTVTRLKEKEAKLLEMSQEVHSLNKIISDLDETLVTLTENITNRDESIAVFTDKIIARDKTITARDETIKEFSDQITALDESIVVFTDKIIAHDKRARDEIVTHKIELKVLQEDITKNTNIVGKLKDDLAHRDTEINSLKAQGIDSERLIESLQAMHMGMQAKIDMYLGSNSWRVTKPLRKILEVLRRALKKNAANPDETQGEVWPDGAWGVEMGIKDHPSNTEISEMDVAVHAHIFYTDLAPDIKEYLENIPVKFKLYISTDTPKKVKEIKNIFECSDNIYALDVRECENKGRDIAPMFLNFGSELAQHEIVLHIHGKRSPHNISLKGWGFYLFETLLGNPERVTSILQAFAEDPSLGLLFPQPYFPIRSYLNVGGNKDNMEKLLVKAGRKIDEFANIRLDCFPSGFMFWFRGKSIEPFKNINLHLDDFEEEAAQVDGTLAHAIERMVVYLAETEGLKSRSYSTYQFDAYDGHSGIDWLGVELEKNLSNKISIIFNHGMGGGSITYSENLTREKLQENKTVIECKYSFKTSRWTIIYNDSGKEVIYLTNSSETLLATLSNIHQPDVIINSIYGFKDLPSFVDNLIAFVEHTDGKIEYKVHDFYAICPSPHLMNYKNQYCHIPKDLRVCNECIARNMGWAVPDCWPDNIVEWRKSFAKLLDVSSTLNFFDDSGVALMKEVFDIDKSKVLVTPHSDDYFSCDRKPDLSGPLHIAVLGTLTDTKGRNVVEKMCKYLARNNDKALLSIIGDVIRPAGPSMDVYGKYTVNDLPDIIIEKNINLIFAASIVPETFSYTISEAMKMGLPVVCFNIGAQANRLKGYKLGKVLPLNATLAEILLAMETLLKVAQER